VGIDLMDLLLSIIVFLIYGTICLISLIFTFSLKTYLKIDEKLNFDIFSTPLVNPLDVNIDWFNEWLMDHNKIIGPILIYLSIVTLKTWFNILYNFSC